MTGPQAVPWLAAVCAAVAFFALGARVAARPPVWPDSLATAVFGRGAPLAELFTRSGYGSAITALSALALGAAASLRAPLLPEILTIALQVVSQSLVRVVKAAWGRVRPPEWLFRREGGFSYPSGHAATAVVFYGCWIAVVAHSALPVEAKAALGAILGIWIAGICWSRVALGAHYPTDVLGGALFGAAFLAAGLGLFARLGL